MSNLILTDDFTTILLKEGTYNIEFKSITREECARMINDAIKDDNVNLISIKVNHDEKSGVSEIDFKYIEQEFPEIKDIRSKSKFLEKVIFGKNDRMIITENYDKKELATRYWLVRYK